MKKTIGIVFGGKSAEHEISILSCRNVFKNLDKSKFIPYLIFIDKSGGWHESDESQLNQREFKPSPLQINLSSGQFSIINNQNIFILIDVFFPVLHGPNGEDGSIQGLFEVGNVAYVGPGIAGSAIAMDKEIAKSLLKQAGIKVADYKTLYSYKPYSAEEIVRDLKLPLVIKPSRAGSSVGITKVKHIDELDDAIKLAFQFDYKILAEEYIKGREIEVAVLGNDNPIASLPGEIVSDFYDYHEKYSSESKTKLEAPAKLPENVLPDFQYLAIKTFKALDCEGMSRVDFFLTQNDIFVNEVNTIPGFTNISMYPKLFELSGIPQAELITKLIEFAIERQERKNLLKSSLF